MILVGIDIANCSATREYKRRAGQEKTRGGQNPVTEPGHRVQGRGQSVCPGLVSEDKRRTREGQEEDKKGQQQEKDNRRTKPKHKAWPQSPATESRGAASQCGQLFFSIMIETSTVNCLGSPGHFQKCTQTDPDRRSGNPVRRRVRCLWTWGPLLRSFANVGATVVHQDVQFFPGQLGHQVLEAKMEASGKTGSKRFESEHEENPEW